MENTKKSKSLDLLKGLASVLGVEELKMSSELAEGSYKLEDGTTFDIDAEGNLVNVVAPTPEEAEAQEAAKAEEEAIEMAKQKEVADKLEAAEKKVAELEAQVLELSKTPKVVPVPKTGKKFEKIELTANMTYAQRVAARIQNQLNN